MHVACKIVLRKRCSNLRISKCSHLDILNFDNSDRRTIKSRFPLQISGISDGILMN